MSEIRLTERGPDLVIETDALAVTLHLERGTFDISQIGPTPLALRDGALVIRPRDTELTSRGPGFDVVDRTDVSDQRGAGLRIALRRRRANGEPAVDLSVTAYESQPYVLLHTELINRTDAAIRIHSFEPLSGARLELPSDPASWRFYKHGWQSWSPTLVLPVAGEDDPVAPPLYAPGTSVERQPGRFASEMVTAIVDPASQTGVVAGFVTAADQFSQLWMERDPSTLTAASYADRLAVAPGQSLASETLLVELTGEPLTSLERYGDVLAGEMQALPYDDVASGWCSWYRYFTEVTEEHIVSNLDDLAAHADDVPVQYVQLDDGYQADIGDWLTVNEKFPHGLRWLVDRIHDRGYQAGLWLAPFLIGANSQLYRDHPDWVVQHKPGRPSVAIINWGQPCYALDLSRDDVIEWLRNVFTTVAEDWGFDYVKIDFIYAGAVDGIRANDGTTRAQLYRRGLQTIRDAVGDRFILGCGDPMGPSIGLVNGSRIGPDVAPFWHPKPFEPIRQRNTMAEPSALNSIRNTITRYWMHGRLWQNDPDCLLVRATDTALTADEVRTLATVIGMTGGMVLDSDDLAALSDKRREIVSLLLPVYGKSAIPTDLFISDMPCVLDLDCRSHRMIALFNWDDAAGVASMNLDERSHVFDAWEHRYLGAHDGTLTLDAAPHACRLLAVRPVLDRPQVVGTSFHLLRGACEVERESWDGESLTVSLTPVAKKRGAIYVWFPDGISPGEVTGVESADVGDGVWSFSLELREPRELVIPTQG